MCGFYAATGWFSVIFRWLVLSDILHYRFKKDELHAPEVNKDKKIRELHSKLDEKELEIKILRDLLKKTYQVMPIESV
jgi:uncharacterized coiled-coil DUF342 family protein